MCVTFTIQGVVPNDDKWKRMKAVYDVCTENRVELPDRVYEFFGGEEPDPAGNIIDITRRCSEIARDDRVTTYELEVLSIPEGAQSIRFSIIGGEGA